MLHSNGPRPIPQRVETAQENLLARINAEIKPDSSPIFLDFLACCQQETDERKIRTLKSSFDAYLRFQKLTRDFENAVTITLPEVITFLFELYTFDKFLKIDDDKLSLIHRRLNQQLKNYDEQCLWKAAPVFLMFIQEFINNNSILVLKNQQQLLYEIAFAGNTLEIITIDSKVIGFRDFVKILRQLDALAKLPESEFEEIKKLKTYCASVKWEDQSFFPELIRQFVGDPEDPNHEVIAAVINENREFLLNGIKVAWARVDEKRRRELFSLHLNEIARQQKRALTRIGRLTHLSEQERKNLEDNVVNAVPSLSISEFLELDDPTQWEKKKNDYIKALRQIAIPESRAKPEFFEDTPELKKPGGAPSALEQAILRIRPDAKNAIKAIRKNSIKEDIANYALRQLYDKIILTSEEYANKQKHDWERDHFSEKLFALEDNLDAWGEIRQDSIDIELECQLIVQEVQEAVKQARCDLTHEEKTAAEIRSTFVTALYKIETQDDTAIHGLLLETKQDFEADDKDGTAYAYRDHDNLVEFVKVHIDYKTDQYLESEELGTLRKFSKQLAESFKRESTHWWFNTPTQIEENKKTNQQRENKLKELSCDKNFLSILAKELAQIPQKMGLSVLSKEELQSIIALKNYVSGEKKRNDIFINCLKTEICKQWPKYSFKKSSERSTMADLVLNAHRDLLGLGRTKVGIELEKKYKIDVQDFRKHPKMEFLKNLAVLFKRESTWFFKTDRQLRQNKRVNEECEASLKADSCNKDFLSTLAKKLAKMPQKAGLAALSKEELQSIIALKNYVNGEKKRNELFINCLKEEIRKQWINKDNPGRSTMADLVLDAHRDTLGFGRTQGRIDLEKEYVEKSKQPIEYPKTRGCLSSFCCLWGGNKAAYKPVPQNEAVADELPRKHSVRFE